MLERVSTRPRPILHAPVLIGAFGYKGGGGQGRKRASRNGPDGLQYRGSTHTRDREESAYGKPVAGA
eukprot:483911-Rhodomonas_salina.1